MVLWKWLQRYDAQTGNHRNFHYVSKQTNTNQTNNEIPNETITKDKIDTLEENTIRELIKKIDKDINTAGMKKESLIKKCLIESVMNVEH